MNLLNCMRLPLAFGLSLGSGLGVMIGLHGCGAHGSDIEGPHAVIATPAPAVSTHPANPVKNFLRKPFCHGVGLRGSVQIVPNDARAARYDLGITTGHPWEATAFATCDDGTVEYRSGEIRPENETR